MVGYLDSSVLLRYILLGDSGLKQVFEGDGVISSELLEIECKRVLYRYRLQGNLDDWLDAYRHFDNVFKADLEVEEYIIKEVAELCSDFDDWNLVYSNTDAKSRLESIARNKKEEAWKRSTLYEHEK